VVAATHATKSHTRLLLLAAIICFDRCTTIRALRSNEQCSQRHGAVYALWCVHRGRMHGIGQTLCLEPRRCQQAVVGWICRTRTFRIHHVVLALVPSPTFDSHVNKRHHLFGEKLTVPGGLDLGATHVGRARQAARKRVVVHKLFNPLPADSSVSYSDRRRHAPLSKPLSKVPARGPLRARARAKTAGLGGLG
jgi:hypothetical protein